MTEYSLTINGYKIGTRNFANLKAGVPIADTIGQNLGMLSATIFRTLGSQYKMPECVPIRQILLNSYSDILLLFSKALKCPLISFQS